MVDYREKILRAKSFRPCLQEIDQRQLIAMDMPCAFVYVHTHFLM